MEAQRAEEDFLEEEDPASVRRSSSRTPTPTSPESPLHRGCSLHAHSLHTPDCITGATHAPRAPLTAASTACTQGVSDKLTSTRAL